MLIQGSQQNNFVINDLDVWSPVLNPGRDLGEDLLHVAEIVAYHHTSYRCQLVIVVLVDFSSRYIEVSMQAGQKRLQSSAFIF